MTRRQRVSGPSRDKETWKPFNPDKINSSTANTPQEVSPPRGEIVRVLIPPGLKEGSKIRVFAGGINGVVLRVPERSAWFVSRQDEKTDNLYFKVRFDATIIYPEVAKEVARENEPPSRDVRLDTAEDRTRSSEDVDSRESIYTAVLMQDMQEYVRRAVDQFGLEAACMKEVARENEPPSREVRLDTAEDKTRSTEDVNSRESVYTAVLMQEYVRRAVDQFGLD